MCEIDTDNQYHKQHDSFKYQSTYQTFCWLGMADLPLTDVLQFVVDLPPFLSHFVLFTSISNSSLYSSIRGLYISKSLGMQICLTADPEVISAGCSWFRKNNGLISINSDTDNINTQDNRDARISC